MDLERKCSVQFCKKKITAVKNTAQSLYCDVHRMSSRRIERKYISCEMLMDKYSKSMSPSRIGWIMNQAGVKKILWKGKVWFHPDSEQILIDYLNNRK